MSNAKVQIAFRIPGIWGHPTELMAALPEGFRLTAEGLVLPGGERVEFGAMDADEQFAGIFRSSCRKPPTAEERTKVDHYKVNVLLSGPGGSPDAARTMMQAAAAIVRAGGAGVFIDNSTVAHGGQAWLELTDDGGTDALTFGYVALIGGPLEVRTMGMHVFGQRDIVMKRADADHDEFGIIEVMRYLCESEKPIDDGHLLADLDGPRFRAIVQVDSEGSPGSPMHNPFGRLKLVSMRDVAEQN